jgi:GlpG protein
VITRAAAGKIEAFVERLPFLTTALIVASVAVAVISEFGATEEALQPLLIASPGSIGLEEIRAGEVWRLLTPVFIHFGPLHLLFNMMWLWDLGQMIEAKKGYRFLGTFVLVIGVAGNVAQYLATGPSFGGMSGVVYGLLGYIWVQIRAGANSGYVLRRRDVITCVGWFFLCWSGLVGPIGNWAHTAGLVGGLAWGYVEAAAARSRALIGRGNGYRITGQYDLAIRDFDKAIERDPGNAEAIAGRALAKWSTGDTVAGRAEIARAKQIDPDIGNAYPELRYQEMAGEEFAGLDPLDIAAVETAKRALVRRILQSIPPSTPPDKIAGARYISFRTDADGVGVPSRLLARYPKQMTVVLHRQYRDLVVTPQTVAVTVSFSGAWETFSIPLSAVTEFHDQAANFTVSFAQPAPRELSSAQR